MMFHARVKNRAKPPKSCESLANGFTFAAKHANFLKIVHKSGGNAFANGQLTSFCKKSFAKKFANGFAKGKKSQNCLRNLLRTVNFRNFEGFWEMVRKKAVF